MSSPSALALLAARQTFPLRLRLVHMGREPLQVLDRVRVVAVDPPALAACLTDTATLVGSYSRAFGSPVFQLKVQLSDFTNVVLKLDGRL